jgi:hypothetical protein
LQNPSFFVSFGVTKSIEDLFTTSSWDLSKSMLSRNTAWEVTALALWKQPLIVQTMGMTSVLSWVGCLMGSYCYYKQPTWFHLCAILLGIQNIASDFVYWYVVVWDTFPVGCHFDFCGFFNMRRCVPSIYEELFLNLVFLPRVDRGAI